MLYKLYTYIYICNMIEYIIKGSLEVKLPTIWRDEKQRREKSRRVEERKRKSQKKEDTGARNVRKDPKHVFFQ